MSESKPPVARVTINIPGKVWEAVTSAAELDGMTRTELVRRALSVDQYFREKVKAGGTILIEQSNGKIDRVVFPY